jgi:endonuclease I
VATCQAGKVTMMQRGFSFGWRSALLLAVTLLLVACGEDGLSLIGDVDGDSQADGDTDTGDGDTDDEPEGPVICNAGEWVCYDDASRWQCNADGTDYTDLSRCEPGQICLTGACVPLVCNPEEWSCYDAQSHWQCNADGTDFLSPSLCKPDEICRFGECESAGTCLPGAWECQDARTRWQCLQSGEGYSAPEPCQSGQVCFEGECTADRICQPGEWACKDDLTRWRCDAYGLAYMSEQFCEEGTHCAAGACVDNGVVDGDEPDGDAIDGDEPDGDVIDGDSTDGDLIDGDEPDGDVTDGDEPDGDIIDGDYMDGDEDGYFSECNGLTNSALESCLENLIDNHHSLGYNSAKDAIFGDIDNEDGWVECVYTGRRAKTSEPDTQNLNTEHTRPQSDGAGSEPARSDIHHLFITDKDANSRRSNLDFGVVVDVTWSSGGSKLGKDADNQTVFEPRDVQKGNTARALFYFSIRYGYSLDAHYEAVLRQWHAQDPPDAKERARNDAIDSYQHNRNPFVDRPEFVGAISDF